MLLRWAALAGSVLLPALGLACVSAPPPVPSKSAAPAPGTSSSILKPGVTVEREIGGGETHEYPLALPASQYLRLRIDQPGVDVTAKLLGAAGDVLAEADDPRGRMTPESLSFLNQGAGEVRLVVRPRFEKAVPGRYRIELEELRPSAPADVPRLAAARRLAEGRGCLEKGTDLNRQSLARFEEALALGQEAGDLPVQTDALIGIGEAHKALADLQSAARSFQKARDLARQAGYRRGEALSTKLLGGIYTDLQERTKALDQLQEALPLWEALDDAGQLGSLLYEIGVALYLDGRHEEALGYIQRALPLREATGDGVGQAHTLGVMGQIEGDQGDTGAALRHLRRSLEIGQAEKDLGVQAMAYYSLARVYRSRGELGPALEYFTQAQDFNRRAEDYRHEFDSLNALGSLYLAVGQPDQALAYYEQSLGLARSWKWTPLEVRALNNIGWTYFSQQRYEEALARCEEALALNDAVQDQWVKALTLHYIGVIHTAAGRPEQGLPSLLEALEMRREGFLSGRILSLLEVGTAYQALGNAGEADSYLGQACTLAASLNASQESTCLYRWALLDRSQGRLEPALEKVEKSIRIIESARSGVASEKLRTSFFATKRGYYELYVDLLMRLGRLDQAFEASERARARGLLDLVAEGWSDIREGIDPGLKEREVELGARLVWLGSEATTARDPAKAAGLQARMRQTEQEMDLLEAEIRNRHPPYAEMRYPQPLGLAAVQGLLDERTALLQYFVGDDRSFLFVLTREGLTAHELPPAAEITESVRQLRDLLKQPRSLSVKDYRTKAHHLYGMLLGPAAEVLSRKPRLLVSPDGALHLLPFEALLTDRAGSAWSGLPYLLRRHVVSYVPSASVLAGLQAARSETGVAAGTKRFLAFADPVYEGETRVAASRDAGPEPLARLPESGREAAAIAKLYPEDSVALYLREAATEANVKKNLYLAGARYVHFATHGLLNDPHPQLAGLALTRDSRSGEDGYLRVLEIFNLKLSSDLVVLSACQTGLGREVRSEGIVGLTRAFLYAGSRSLLVSLWNVADGSTPDLMESFYRHLGDSGARAEALRKSKLDMIDSGPFSHPYYWAPFVLSGDPGRRAAGSGGL